MLPTGKITSIYGLFDPRSPDMIMYVGKGGGRRAQRHWRHFQHVGKAVNVLLFRWFEQLKVDSVEPGWRFLAESPNDWQEAEQFLIGIWRAVNPSLCNVSRGGTPSSQEAASLGGIANAGRGLRKAYELHPEIMREGNRRGGRRLAELYPGKAKEWGISAGKAGGPKGGRRVHELHPELAKENGRKGGPKGCHNRWHVARGIVNPLCQLCRPEFFDLWEGGNA